MANTSQDETIQTDDQLTARLTFTCTKAMRNDILKAAKKQHRNHSSLLRHILATWLDTHKKG